ncbi:MAG: histidinol dehydrogenase [Treponema sp.]|nr:histidinol dehydrogenase [Treponema sp.]MCL2237603.1 histidinol dehydrogenase [Treponema sp.]
MKIINSSEFDAYWKNIPRQTDDPRTEKTVKKVIADVRKNGDAAIKKYASKWDKSSPSRLEVPFSIAKKALDDLRASEPSLVTALELAALNIKNFACKQREQFADFDVELNKGIITGQRIIPVEHAGVYIPGGRFPLFSSVLMCMIPAFCAGANEVILSSSPAADGLPDKKTLAAAIVAANICGKNEKDLRIFSIGGAQAIAALAIGTESVPRVDVIAGPGNRFVAAAKKQLFGEVGIDFIAGPSDILVITDDESTVNLAAADMIGQAEHDPDARARALVSSKEIAEKIASCMESRLNELPENNKKTARASLNAGGLIVICKDLEDMVRIANAIAPEHLELQTLNIENIIPKLRNYGSLFIGAKSAEVLGDYSAGVNHTLPTETCARFTGGLSVRHFLKTVTTLRCTDGEGYEKARNAAEIIGRAEGLEAHAQSAAIRKE